MKLTVGEVTGEATSEFWLANCLYPRYLLQEIGFWRGEFDRSIQNETQRIYYHTQTSQNQMQQLMDIKNKYSTNQVCVVLITGESKPGEGRSINMPSIPQQ